MSSCRGTSVSLLETPTHSHPPWQSPTWVLSDQNQSRRAENTPVQVCRPGALRRTRVWGTSPPEAWTPRHLAKVSECTRAVFGSKWPHWNTNGQLTSCWWSEDSFGGNQIASCKSKSRVWSELVLSAADGCKTMAQGLISDSSTWSSLISGQEAQTTNRPFLTPQAAPGELRGAPLGTHPRYPPYAGRGHSGLALQCRDPAVLESKAWFPGSYHLLVWIWGALLFLVNTCTSLY